MDESLSSLPGYQLHDYMLVLQPHEELREKILKVKKEFATTYDAPSAAWGKPQVTLVKFSQLKMMEERITNRLRMIAMSLPAFKVELKNFGSYPSHTIFINIESKVPLQMVVKHLKTAQILLKTKEQKPQFMDNFSINIARQLLPWQYEKGWLEYNEKHFSGRFIATHLVLLRRKQGEKSYSPIANFEFQNMPVVTKQGQLF